LGDGCCVIDQWSSSSYSASQVTGSPNTGLNVGDNQSESGNAWAEASSDRDNEQTLMLNYPEPVNISQIVARETFNAGSISKVELM
jgi:hypothetical protein